MDFGCEETTVTGFWLGGGYDYWILSIAYIYIYMLYLNLGSVI